MLDDAVVLRETTEASELGGGPQRKQHRHPLARLIASRDAPPGQCAQRLQRRADAQADRVLREPLPLAPLEAIETRHADPAALQVDQHPPAQRLPDRSGLAPEPVGHGDIPQEPLEDRALEKTLVGVGPGTIRPSEAFAPEAVLEHIGALDDCLRKGRGYTDRGCLGAGMSSAEEIRPAHGRLPAPITGFAASRGGSAPLPFVGMRRERARGADEDIPLPQTPERLQLGGRAHRQEHRQPIARLVRVRDPQPDTLSQDLQRNPRAEVLPILGEPLTMKPSEIEQNCRGESAAVEIPRQPPDQRLLDRLGVPPELDGDDDVAKEPLEQQALEDAGLALEALAIGVRGGLFQEPDPKEIRAADDAVGEGRSDPAGCRLDALIVAPESLNPSHGDPRPAPERARSLEARLSQESRSCASATWDRAGPAGRFTSGASLSRPFGERPRKGCTRIPAPTLGSLDLGNSYRPQEGRA